MSDNEEPDSPPCLSAATAALLQTFLQERHAAEEAAAKDPFAENWQLSQFWYTDDTAATIAAEVVPLAAGGAIACIACPSLFRRLRADFPDQPAHLLEYDPRFEVLGNFSLYDYNQPLCVAEALHGAFEVVVADPPYLAEECLGQTAKTMRLLSRRPANDPRFLLLTGKPTRTSLAACFLTQLLMSHHPQQATQTSRGTRSKFFLPAGRAGAVMQDAAKRLLNMRPATFRPQHSNKLGNEFLLYATAEPSQRLGGWDTESDAVD